MLQNTHLVGFGALRDSHKLIDIVNRMGLASSCVLCLDAADEVSYTSGQTWTDRSGGGNNYFLGTTNGVDATDPTFNGVAGDSGAYFSFDGGDYFVRTAAQTFDATWHQNNGAFTIMALIYPLAVKAADSPIFANRTATAANAGVRLFLNDEGKLRLQRSYTTTLSTQDNSSAEPVGASWNVVGAGWDEATGLIRMQINGTHESQVGLTSTDTDAVSGTQTIGAYSGGATPVEATERLAGIIAFSRLLTESEMSGLRALISSTRSGYA